MKPIPKPQLSVAPAALAVDLTEAKTFMRVDASTEDTQITTMIKAAIGYVEKHISKKLINQTWNTFYDCFPNYQSGNDEWWDGVRDGAINQLTGAYGALQLPFEQVSSVTSIETFDNTDTSFAFAGSNYYTSLIEGKISLRLGSVWPTTVLRPQDGIKVIGVFGYGATSTAIPDDIRQAILMIVSKLYEHRGDNVEGEEARTTAFTIPNTAMVLLEGYRRMRIG